MASSDTIKTAVVLLVQAAVGAREELSVRGIRRTLEARFSCDLSARKDLILRTIQETLEDDYVAPFDCDADEAVRGSKRRKLAEAQVVSNAVRGDGASSAASGKRARILQTTARVSSIERPFACDECEFRSARNSDLTTHNRIHTGERPFACDACDYRSVQLSTIIRHRAAHGRKRPLACDECNCRFTSSRHLSEHKFAMHSGSKHRKQSKAHGSSQSARGATTTSKQARLPRSTGALSTDTPTRAHVDNRPHACNECEFRFAHKCDLTRHLRVHTGERPFACDECEFRCSQSGTLASHKRLHSGKGLYACDQCNLRCASRSNLTIHKRTHSGQS